MGKNWSRVLYNIRRGNYHPFANNFWRLVSSARSRDGVDVVSEDWDYLIVLDACRYDVFAEHNRLDGDLQKRTSRGSKTTEWLSENFPNYYDDIVYVSANPFTSQFGFDAGDHFLEHYPVFLQDDSQEKGATTPEALNKRAVEVDEERPNKRKIIHYVQPHRPYIGDVQLEQDDKGNLDTFEFFRKHGAEKIKEAYVSNLYRVLEAVEELLTEIEGRIVVTADHGEAFGEKGVLEHPPGVHIRELVEVPWLVIEQGDRPRIESSDVGGIEL